MKRRDVKEERQRRAARSSTGIEGWGVKWIGGGAPPTHAMVGRARTLARQEMASRQHIPGGKGEGRVGASTAGRAHPSQTHTHTHEHTSVTPGVFAPSHFHHHRWVRAGAAERGGGRDPTRRRTITDPRLCVYGHLSTAGGARRATRRATTKQEKRGGSREQETAQSNGEQIILRFGGIKR